MSELERRFVHRLLHAADAEQSDLRDMMFMLARLEQASLDPKDCESSLHSLQGQAQVSLAKCDTAKQRCAELCRFVAHEEGFTGNTEDYYSPANSNIHRVLQSRRGIPITLAFVYIQLAWVMGWAASGIAFPGHFLVAIFDDEQGALRGQACGEGSALLDPFRGVALSEADCLRLLQSQFGESAKLQKHFFDSAGNASYMCRMLRNLKHCYVRAEDYSNALRIVNLLLEVSPGDIAELHDRAAILEHMHCYSAAAADLQSISSQRPNHPRLAEIKHTISRLEKRRAPTLH